LKISLAKHHRAAGPRRREREPLRHSIGNAAAHGLDGDAAESLAGFREGKQPVSDLGHGKSTVSH